MNKITLVKGASKLVVSVGVSMIVTNVIKSTKPASTNILTNVCVGAAGLVIGWMFADAVEKYMDEGFDSIENTIKEIITEINKVG